MAMTNEEILKALRTDIESGKNLGEVHARVVAMLAAGIARDGMIAALMTLHLEYRDPDQDPWYDVATDMLDFFYGFCSPQARL